MNPSHYPDLERCKKLTELGFPDTEAEWHLLIEENDMVISRMTSTMNELFITSDKIPTGNYVCPSVMEMMDVIRSIKLPSSGDKWSSHLEINTNAPFETVSIIETGVFRGAFSEDVVKMFDSGNVPNALADLTIWLVENSHLTFDKR